MPHPHDQERYQIRFDWGLDGLARLAPADVVIVVDLLDVRGTGLAEIVAASDGALVLAGGVRNAAAVADAVLAAQTRKGSRAFINIIAVGEQGRFAIEDQLGAGAVIAALGNLGIDSTSPESAVVAEGFRGLKPAVRHLLTAAATGQELIELGRRDEVLAAGELDADAEVIVLSD